LRLEPGERGIIFHRSDTGGSVRAHYENVAATRLATVIEEDGTRIQTVEHLMSALAAYGIADAEITLSAPEVPIMDGSALPFMEALRDVVEPAPPRAPFRVLKPVMVEDGSAFAALIPHEGQRFDVCIDFKAEIIGVQRVVFDLTAEGFAAEIAPARTFGPLKDVKRMRRRGYAKGASLENAIAVDGKRVANPEGLRFDDEFARHKLLDAIGDLSLAGRPILGLYRAHKGGHRLNYELLRALFAAEENVAIVA